MRQRAGRRNLRLEIQRPIPDTSHDGAGSGSWQTVGHARASVIDVLPSRGDRGGGAFDLQARPAKVEMRYRTDILPSMRFVLGDRIMEIVAGPAELGRRDGIEFMVEDYRPAGNRA